jgi:hypothetical protein
VFKIDVANEAPLSANSSEVCDSHSLMLVEHVDASRGGSTPGSSASKTDAQVKNFDIGFLCICPRPQDQMQFSDPPGSEADVSEARARDNVHGG